MINSRLITPVDGAKELLSHWSEGGTILHIWQHDEGMKMDYVVYTAVVLFDMTLVFYRLFTIGGKYQISTDREIPLELAPMPPFRQIGGLKTGSYCLSPTPDYDKITRIFKDMRTKS